MTDEQRKQWEDVTRKLLLAGEDPERLREDVLRAEYETYHIERGEKP